jgi:uncharacterized protein
VELILAGAILVVLIVAANFIEARRQSEGQHWFHWLLLAVNAITFTGGLMLAVQPPEAFVQGSAEVGAVVVDPAGVAWLVIAIGLWGMFVSLYPVRRLIARVSRVDPSSTVHAAALMLCGYLAGEALLVFTQGGLEQLTDTVEPVSVGVVVLSELLFVGAALLGVGAFIRRRGRELLRRLGLERIRARDLLTALGWISLMVVVQTIGGAAWAAVNPDQAEALSEINNLLMEDFDSIPDWLILALATGIGEEILFRGALQPVFGLVATSALFAIVHVQYGFTPFLLIVVFLALVFGYLRRRYNTTYVILVHAGYNFTLGLMALLATYLAEFAS